MVGSNIDYSSRNGFRPEIAGLRAIAVIAVILCHLNIGSFAGGFVGVDVFFVISGFLISKHILGDVERGRFSFVDFYLRRTRRIFPALVAVVIATFVAGCLWLPPELLRGLAKESTHALLSIANIQYWREAKEYFAATSDQLPLLHIWSLSLEEQFYLVWPLLLVMAARLRIVVIAVAIAALASLCAVILMRSDAQAAFFLMPFRIFEFSIGAMAIYVERAQLPRMLREVLAASGLAAVIAAILVVNPATAWPGLATLAPCLGTAAIIAAGSQTLVARAIGNIVMRGVGAISYSLYLCHWPLIFFARFIFGPEVLSPAVDLLLIAMMLILAWACYRFIETPFRRPTALPSKQLIARFAGCTAALVVMTHGTYVLDGLPLRLSSAQAETARLQGFGMNPCTEIARRHCAFGEVGAAPRIELVGDSFVHQYVAAFDPLLKRLALQGESSTLGGCPILVGTLLKGPRLEECRRTRDDIFRRLASSKVDIVLGQAWDIYTDSATVSDFERPDLPSGEQRSLAQLQVALERTIELLSIPGRKFMIIGAQVRTTCAIDRTRLQPGPLWHAPQPRCDEITRARASQAVSNIDTMLETVRAKWPDRVTLLRPIDYMCGDVCPLTKDDLWLYEDSGHFTVAGSQLIGLRARDAFSMFLSGRQEALAN